MGAQTEFCVEVVRVGAIEPHPNADTLSLTNVNGYPVVLKTGSFQPGDLAVYIPVDALVPTSRPEFAFLRKEGVERHRVRAARLRGTYSQGLLVPAPAEVKEGQDMATFLNVEKYLSPIERAELNGPRVGGRPVTIRDPGFMPVYGLDALRKYGDVLEEGESVEITEKIHGCNARFAYRDGRLWVGSHRVMRGAGDHAFVRFFKGLWRKVRGAKALQSVDALGVWWEAARNYDLERVLSRFPNKVVYGEIYGAGVQDLTYDAPDRRKLVVFDVLDLELGRYLHPTELQWFCNDAGLEKVPVLYRGPWKPHVGAALAEGPTVLGVGRHVREGVVVKPMIGRNDPKCGRVALKLVGEDYHLRKEAK